MGVGGYFLSLMWRKKSSNSQKQRLAEQRVRHYDERLVFNEAFRNHYHSHVIPARARTWEHIRQNGGGF